MGGASVQVVQTCQRIDRTLVLELAYASSPNTKVSRWYEELDITYDIEPIVKELLIIGTNVQTNGESAARINSTNKPVETSAPTVSAVG